MTIQDLNQAITECDGGLLVFNLGEARAFLFKNKWYPLRAAVNRACEIAGQEHDLTTDRALVKLAFLGLWTRIQKINFQNQLPVEIAIHEKLNEIKKLADAITGIAS